MSRVVRAVDLPNGQLTEFFRVSEPFVWPIFHLPKCILYMASGTRNTGQQTRTRNTSSLRTT